ncbi:hypothetical protein [Paenibacillus sp. Leaf72]|uniref:hypothetical protein n=1 Tax=Paenibacillus sp. Leaf72 TaxID=1736234 RepID=UPI0006FC9EC9|nr:hypothetical protein [Paenibacillus sp. Leaf72]KQN96916.1 hypothetical protein ASF12_22875 [Paenibacillus sp. Leaf72]
MNSFTRTITNIGMTEKLEYKGVTYTKRYVKDNGGYTGLDQAWENETDLPDEVIDALENDDALDIMDALK